MAAHKTFYAIALEEGDSFRIARDELFDTPLVAKTKRAIRKLRRGLDCVEGLSILRCEIVE